jgi:hypothetical protein
MARIKAVVRTEEVRTSHTAHGKVEWCSHCGKQAQGVAQVVKCLPSKSEALSSSPCTAQNKTTKISTVENSMAGPQKVKHGATS